MEVENTTQYLLWRREWLAGWNPDQEHSGGQLSVADPTSVTLHSLISLNTNHLLATIEVSQANYGTSLPPLFPHFSE